MTKEQVNCLADLYEMFQIRCEKICKILTPLNSSYSYLTNFDFDKDEIYGEGDEYWQYGGHEYHSQSFPTEYLTMSDEEIQSIVEEELERRADKIKTHKDVQKILLTK